MKKPKACPKCGCTLYPNMIVESGCPRCLRTHTKAGKRIAAKPMRTYKCLPGREPPKVLDGWIDLEEAAFGKRKKAPKK